MRQAPGLEASLATSVRRRTRWHLTAATALNRSGTLPREGSQSQHHTRAVCRRPSHGCAGQLPPAAGQLPAGTGHSGAAGLVSTRGPWHTGWVLTWPFHREEPCLQPASLPAQLCSPAHPSLAVPAGHRLQMSHALPLRTVIALSRD